MSCILCRQVGSGPVRLANCRGEGPTIRAVEAIGLRCARHSEGGGMARGRSGVNDRC
jgi:hypothetical protein